MRDEVMLKKAYSKDNFKLLEIFFFGPYFRYYIKCFLLCTISMDSLRLAFKTFQRQLHVTMSSKLF